MRPCAPTLAVAGGAGARSAGAGLGKSFSLFPCQRRGPCAVVTRSRAPPPPQPGLASPGRKGRPGPGRGGGGPAGGPGKATPAPPPPGLRSTSAAQPFAPAPPPAPQLPRAAPSSPGCSGPRPLPVAGSPAHSLCGALAARPPATRGRSRPLRGSLGSAPRPAHGPPRLYRAAAPIPPRHVRQRRPAPRRPGVPAPAPRSGQGAHGVQPNSRKQGRAPHAPAREVALEELLLQKHRSPISLPPTQK